MDEFVTCPASRGGCLYSSTARAHAKPWLAQGGRVASSYPCPDTLRDLDAPNCRDAKLTYAIGTLRKDLLE